jgi:hypothetical protein
MKNLRLFICLFAVALSSAAMAFFREFSFMAPYDDEGTLMLSLQRFFQGQPLYNSTKTIYGPLYYFYEWLAHVLSGAPPSHDLIRWVTAAWWVAASLLIFLIVYRATDSLFFASAAHFAGFRALGFLGIEPAHPQEACITLLLAIALAATSRRTSYVWFVFGLLTGAMALTKINLAILVLAALGVLFAMTLGPGVLRRIAAPAAWLGAIVLAPMLMKTYLLEPWCARYAALVVLSLLAVLPAASRIGIEPFARLRDAALAVSGFVVILLAIGAFPLLTGSTPGAMYYELIVWPATHFVTSWVNPLQVRPAVLLWAAICVAAAWSWRSGRLPEAVIPSLKILFAVLVAGLSLVYAYHELASIGTPMLWLAAIPPTAGPGKQRTLLRPLLAVLGVLQVLYAFPVAGAQGQFITVTFVPAAAICLHDALPWLAARIPAPAIPPAAATLVLVALYAHDVLSARARFASLQPLGLPGAQILRIEPEVAGAMRRLSAAAQGCTMLVTQPGMFSLNLFSGRPGLNSISASSWFLFMNESEQRAAIAELERQPRACAVVNTELVGFWAHRTDISGQPLPTYIRERFEPEFEIAGYRFMRAR